MAGDLFPDAPRRTPRKLMHVADAAEGRDTVVMRCGAGHARTVLVALEHRHPIGDEYTPTELNRGIVCGECEKVK